MKSALLVLCVSLFLALTANAQVAVYRLSFRTVGPHANYQSFQDGYYVAPSGGGSGTMILLQRNQLGNLFYTYTTYGQMFFANTSSGQVMVLSAVSTSSASSTTFYAIGNVDYQVTYAATLPAPGTTSTSGATGSTSTTGTAGNFVGDSAVAHVLTGYEITADSQSDMPFVGNTSTVGVAGTSTMTMTVQTDLTSLANGSAYSLAGTVTYIENLLLQQGYTAGATTSGSTSTSSGTNSPTEVPTSTTPTTTTGG